MKNRPSYASLIEDLAFANGKMAFVTGPRQVGKTTLAEMLIRHHGEGRLYNWDDIEFKRAWIKDPKQFVPQIIGVKPLIVFDELHKAPRWKSYLKGVYDMRKTNASILVTGSAKLDVFRKGGESLLGRYFLFRLHPFTMGELTDSAIHPSDMKSALKSKLSENDRMLKRLLKFGGFPEPYLKADEVFANVWQRSRLERLVREDLRDMTRAQEISMIEAAVSMIPQRVGSLFSVQSLAEDIQTSHPTVKRWIDWLRQLFYLYPLPPYGKNIARSLKKQPKIYLWDWAEVHDASARFENMVAGHLHKAVHHWTDSGIGTFELHYVRDKEKREVDFLVTWNGKPWLLAECKKGGKGPAENLKRFAHILRPDIVIQIVEEGGVHEAFDLYDRDKGYIISAGALLRLF